ncbi:DNA alkylation repair protein [Blastococcus sp. VKM Ac-2987]|uniref:DNA alkylation repair protein n=1 Tax=Blastococcus sp. VKM Ac-2987 TaxID=3004141 RepID=UPI0022AB9D95|nr:DNA alkylation repair protein [Blastococcus sp. VKM Ac-2987]MCZ2858607.1 DNA alkylation repair protein [Blastococcus sp. VKM Ac-2987]
MGQRRARGADLASLLDDPALVDGAQFERWAAGFESWDLCDQVCQILLRYAAPAWTKAAEWTARPEPLVKRAGLTLMAGLAVADKKAEQLRAGGGGARWVAPTPCGRSAAPRSGSGSPGAPDRAPTAGR